LAFDDPSRQHVTRENTTLGSVLSRFM
jgi:hypothetical protein